MVESGEKIVFVLSFRAAETCLEVGQKNAYSYIGIRGRFIDS